MKRMAGVILLLIGLWLGANKSVNALDCTQNSVTCLQWDSDNDECGSSNGDVAACVESGTSCDWSYNQSLLDCGMCMPHGAQCYDKDIPLPSGATPAPTSTQGVACGDSTFPACNGSCAGSNVCKSIYVSSSCECGPATGCADYVPTPNILATARLTPTSARFRWSPIDTQKYPYVERIALIVEETAANLNTCMTAAIRGDASSVCNVYQPNLAVSATSYTATGALVAGTEYEVRVIFITFDPPGLLPVCINSDRIDYLSSCELTPDPTTIEVGETQLLTTNLVANTWYVSYTRAPTAYATVTTPDNALPYRTTVTGVADGTTLVTGNVYTYATPPVLACSDTATVTVGTVVVSANPWWQTIGGSIHTQRTTGTVLRSRLPAGEYLIKRVTGGTSGLLSYGGGTVVLVGGTVSQDGWKAKSLYTGKTMNYAYFAKNMGVATSGQAKDWAGDAMTKPAYNANKVFYYQDPVGTASLAAVWNVANGQKYVVFVNGDLEIDQNINVAPGGFLAFIVSGEITVDPAVTYMEGLFVSNGNFSTISKYVAGVTNDSRLLVEGSVITWGSIDLNRNLGDAANATLPAEQVTYRPDLLTNMPDRMKSFALEWKEVPAGTFGE